MHLYTIAMRTVEEKINSINSDYQKMNKKDIINHVLCRIKSPESILVKMKQRNYEMTYKNLVEKINDIAGVRIICPYKSNVFDVIRIIKELEDWKVIIEKDYITNPKKTGYSSYHMIVEVPVNLEGSILYTKVEIQIRTMAMDFWATLEHDIKYKKSGELSPKISRDLVFYAKLINKIDSKLTQINNRKIKKNFGTIE